jgi:hypothetical protein
VDLAIFSMALRMVFDIVSMDHNWHIYWDCNRVNLPSGKLT